MWVQVLKEPAGLRVAQQNDVCVPVVVESTERQPGGGEPASLESDQPAESAESHAAGEEHGE